MVYNASRYQNRSRRVKSNESHNAYASAHAYDELTSGILSTSHLCAPFVIYLFATLVTRSMLTLEIAKRARSTQFTFKSVAIVLFVVNEKRENGAN